MAIETVTTYRDTAPNLQLIYKANEGTFSINGLNYVGGSLQGLRLEDIKAIRKFVNDIDAIINPVP